MLFRLFLVVSLSLWLAKGEEYCIFEVFQPRCQQNEIVIIEEAIFGRKTTGRCLLDEGTPNEANLKDSSFIGCYADVKNILESQCVGKQQCDLSVAKIKVKTTCHQYLKHYLEVEYRCLPIVQDSHHCAVKLESGIQYLATSKISNSCGSKAMPWTVETAPGQKIKTTIVELSSNQTAGRNGMFFDKIISGNEENCQRQGFLIDQENKQKIVICMEDYKTQNHGRANFYVSITNSIKIIMEAKEGQKLQSFLIALETTGCSDLIPPADAWLKRTENEAIIGCYSTRLRWQLKCQGQRWIGVIGNCSHGHDMSKEAISESKPIENNENSVVSIVAIAMSGFVICFLIVCLGLVVLNRYYAMSKSKAMKQISQYGKMEHGLPTNMYNNGSIRYPGSDQFYEADKTILNANGAPPLSEVVEQDSAPYFELDQAFMKKPI